MSRSAGEPLIYPNRGAVAGLLIRADRLHLHQRPRHAAENARLPRRHPQPRQEPILARLLSEKLITDKEADTIRKGRTNDRPVISPTQWMYWNVHIDGRNTPTIYR